MILYTRSFFYDHVDNIYARKAYNLSLYNEIGIPFSEKADRIMQVSGGYLLKGESILVAEINREESITFAILDRNSFEVEQKLFDSIIAAMAENKSVYYVDDFYKANGLTEVT